MTFEEYWQNKERANPALKDGSAKMSISVESFRRQMRQAFYASKQEPQSGDFFEYLKKAVGK